MRSLCPAFLLMSALAACGTTQGGGVDDRGVPNRDRRHADDLPQDVDLRGVLTGDFHGYWTGAASGTVLKAKDGALLEVPVVLAADLDRNLHWNMDATDVGELILERAGHYNSSVWFVATDIEVAGRRVWITKGEENYEDTLCLELLGVDTNGSLRFQARSFLADPGEGERDECLAGSVRYDATLLLLPGRGDAPEFTESGNTDDWGAEPPGRYNGGDDDEHEESDEL